jgi:hypothetical protein
LKFHKDMPQRDCVLFHTDDSRFVLYASKRGLPNSEGNIGLIVGRAGGNKAILDTYYGNRIFPEVWAVSGMEEWHLVTTTWLGYPNGTLRMYFDGNLVMERSYDPRFDNGLPLPVSIAVGIRPPEWVGALIEQADGTVLDVRPDSTLSIVDSGVEFRDLRLYRECLSLEQVLALAFASKSEELSSG